MEEMKDNDLDVEEQREDAIRKADSLGNDRRQAGRYLKGSCSGPYDKPLATDHLTCKPLVHVTIMIH
jgi:hypothetical protein